MVEILEKLERALQQAGARLDQVVKTTMFVTDRNDWQTVGRAHAEVFGSPPERDVTRWFSDASVLTRYGIATLNYGTSSGLPDAGDSGS